MGGSCVWRGGLSGRESSLFRNQVRLLQAQKAWDWCLQAWALRRVDVRALLLVF